MGSGSLHGPSRKIVRVDAFFGPDREGVVKAIGVQDEESVGRAAL